MADAPENGCENSEGIETCFLSCCVILELQMKDLIVEYTGKLDEDEEVPGCSTCCRPSARVYKRDGVWSWVVCVAGVLSNAIILGCAYTFGVIFPTLLDEFKGGKAKTAMIGSIAVAGGGLFAPVAAKLIDRFGCRMVTIAGALTCAVGLLTTSQAPNIDVIFLTYSIIFGFGSACMYTSSFVIVPKYFHKWRPFAIGLVSTGPGAGMFVMSPIVQALLDKFGWRGAYIGQAGLCMIVSLLACTFEPNVEGDVEENYKVKLEEIEHGGSCSRTKLQRLFSFDFSFLRNTKYTVCTISFAVLHLGIGIPPIHMARHSESLGISADRASQLYFYYGLTAMISRAAVGSVCNRDWANPLHFYRAAVLVSGLATVLVSLAHTYTGLLAYIVVFGLAEGSISTPINILLLTILTPQQRAQGFGFSMCLLCLTLTVGPPFAGFLADKFGSYAPAFHVAGGIEILAALITFLLLCFKTSDTKVQLEDNSYSEEELIVTEKLSVL